MQRPSGETTSALMAAKFNTLFQFLLSKQATGCYFSAMVLMRRGWRTGPVNPVMQLNTVERLHGIFVGGGASLQHGLAGHTVSIRRRSDVLCCPAARHSVNMHGLSLARARPVPERRHDPGFGLAL